MAKKFCYVVNNKTFTDSKPFDRAWKEAKEEATATHSIIHRLVVESDGNVKEQVFVSSGVFLNITLEHEAQAYRF